MGEHGIESEPHLESPNGAAPPDPNAQTSRVPLGRLLIAGGFIDEEQLNEALEETTTGRRLGEVVVRRGWASEDDVAKALAEQWQLTYAERASIWFDADALERLSRDEAQQIGALPTRIQDGRVVVAVAEPTEERLAKLRAVIGDDTLVVVVPKSALDAGLSSDLLTNRKHESPGEHQMEEPHAPAPAAASPREAPTPLIAPAVHAGTEQPTDSTLLDASSQLERAHATLEDTASEVAALQASLNRLSARVHEALEDLGAVLAQPAKPSEEATIRELEAQLAHRTERAERLKAHLDAVTQTLQKNYD